MALLLAWIGGLIYSLLSGLDLPAQRALLMLTVVILSFFIRSSFNLLHSINTVLVLVVIIYPLAVLAESFWLTISALMIIAFGAFILQQQPSRIKQLLVIQLLFSILFIPLSIFIFGQIHSASIAANLIAVPFISFIIVPLNFILLTLFWLPQPVLQLLYALVDYLLELLMSYLNWLQNNGLNAIEVAEIEEWKLILILIFIVLLLMPRGFISRAMALFLLPPLVFWNQHQLTAKELKMTVLDVGMGTAVILQTAHHSLVYDFGPGNEQGYSLGLWAVLPYMHNQGIDKPHRIVISHADQDHSGGFYALQQKYEGIPLFSGTVPEVKHKFPELQSIKDCHLTKSWMWDGVKFEFIGKQPEQSVSENNRSCVLKVSLNENSVLISGDIEFDQEIQLIKENPEILRATVLVVPHHGSETSSSEAFIKAVDADGIIFTTGYLNRWKFPRSKIVQRYAKTGAQLMQTDKTGAIQVYCSEVDCKIKKFRHQHPRLWY